jgi:hypothetical protein
VASHKMLLTTIMHDSVSGNDMPWQCVAASDRASAEELMVDSNSLVDAAAALCTPS